MQRPTQNDQFPTRGKFKLFQYFVIMSILAICAILLLAGFGLNKVLYNYVMNGAEHESIPLTKALSDLEKDVLIHYNDAGIEYLALYDNDKDKFDRRIRNFLAPLEIVKIKVYDLDKTIIYSTESDLIGKVDKENKRLAIALSGRPDSHMEHKDKIMDVVGEHRLLVNVVETYVPIRGPSNSIIGSFEVYKDVTPDIIVAKSTLNHAIILLAMVLTPVFVVLCSLMYYAARTINVHTTALEKSHLELVKAWERADSADRAKSDFLAQMSHEIRTPMTAILGFVDLIAIGCQDTCVQCQENAEYTSIIKRNGNHLIQLINDILDLSKIEAGKIDIELLPYSPCDILYEVESLMQVRAADKNINFAIDIVGDMPETIISDPTRIRQILVNLIGNAIKFTDTGEVRITMRYDSEKCAILYSITDTGVGIPNDQINKLFRPFTQADSSTSRKFGGTGLGLTISQHLARLLGGDITVSSTPGKGSTFTVKIRTGQPKIVNWIPVDQLENSKQAWLKKNNDIESDDSRAALIGAHILLAEDGKDNQRLISHILSKAGVMVTIAENGREVIDHITAHLTCDISGKSADDLINTECEFDLILMDMQMPEMDGYEATALLRTRGFTRPIIALTAHAMSDSYKKCIDAGCDAYATKPINRKLFFDILTKYMAISRAGTPSSEGCIQLT